MSFFDRLRTGLSKTRQRLLEPLEEVFSGHRNIDQDFYDELEEVLVSADVGLPTVERILQQLKERVRAEHVQEPSEVRELLKETLIAMVELPMPDMSHQKPQVIMAVGVNGVGKTTSIAKLALHYHQEETKVLLVAGDTFRAAAADQLTIWAERLNVPIIAHQEGGDPAAVVFDGMVSANAQKIPMVIVDTAGRLHTKQNLLAELGKVYRVVDQNKGDRVMRVLLVLDATTGQNAIAQAKTFNEVVGIDGIILTKLDGTAKGGIILAIADQLQLPIVWIGVGETAEDFRPFDAKAFVEALFA